MPGEFSHSKNNKLNFKKLPLDVQKKLALFNRRGEDRFVFWSKPSLFSWLCVLLPLVWIAYLLYATRGALWEEWMAWLYTGLTVAAAFLFVFGLVKVLSGYAAKVKNGYIFTPNEFIKIKDNCVQSWSLTEVEALIYLEDERRLEVGIAGSEEKFKTANSFDVRKLGETFDPWKRQATGNFLAAYEKPEFAYHPGGKTVLYAAIAIAAIILGVGSGYAAKGLNRSYDDEQTWKTASTEGTIKALDGYKSRHPQGKYVSNADEKISALLGALKTQYLSKVTKEADPKAVTAFTSLLDSLSKDPHMTIYVRVKETRELDSSVVGKAKKVSGEAVYEYEQTLPSAKTEERKNLIFEKFKHAFGLQIENVDVNFERTEAPPDGAALIDIGCTLKSQESIYTFFSMTGRGGDSYYPGVIFIFDFTLKPGGSPDAFQVNFENAPRKFDTGAFKQADSGNYSFDWVLFGAASDNFRNFIQAKFGFIDITNT